MVVATVSHTSFDVTSVNTQKIVYLHLLHISESRNLFSDLTDQSMDQRSFLKTRVKGGKRV